MSKTTEISLNPNKQRSRVLPERNTEGAPLKAAPPGLRSPQGGEVKQRTARLTFSGCPVRAGQKQGDLSDNPSDSFSPQIHDEGCKEARWRRETADLSSPAPREISSSHPSEGGERESARGGEGGQSVVFS